MKLVKRIILGFLVIIGVLLLTACIYCLIRGMNPLALLNETKENPHMSAVVYKTVDNQDLEADIYLPTRTLFRRSPVVFYLHGGSWKSGSRHMSADEMDSIVNPLSEFGITVVSVGYRLTDEQTKFPAHIEDVTDAIRYVVQQADDLGIDQDRMCTMGASAGAHLALLAALAGEQFTAAPDLSEIDFDIRCVVAIAGPTDLVDLSFYTPDQRLKINDLLFGFFGARHQEVPDVYAAASPVSYIQSEQPPIFMAHGDMDTLVPIAMPDQFVMHTREAGAQIEYIRVLNGDHSLQPAEGDHTEPEMSEVLQKMILFVIRKLII